MDYHDKLVLAPMVRVGTLPMRLLAAQYGADIVYSEELVDKRVMASVRRVNEALGTVDFLDKGGEQGGRVMFRTLPAERPRLVFQLGTADPVAAVAAAQVVAADVGAIDVNMGCPKQFSLQGGMGAALLRKPETAEDILKTLRRNLQLPVSCKIRLLDDPRDTVELARRLAACGISALAVHGRTTQQRPRDPADWGPIRLVVDALAGLPVIANGDVISYEDAQRVRQETGCAAAMFARAAMWNASVFRPQGFLPLDEVQRQYLRLSLQWGNALPNTKYVLKEMADAPVSFAGRRGGPASQVGHEGNTALTRARDEAALCALLGLAADPPYEDLKDVATSAYTPGGASTGASSKSKGGRPLRGRQGHGDVADGGGDCGHGKGDPPALRIQPPACASPSVCPRLPPPGHQATPTASGGSPPGSDRTGKPSQPWDLSLLCPGLEARGPQGQDDGQDGIRPSGQGKHCSGRCGVGGPAEAEQVEVVSVRPRIGCNGVEPAAVYAADHAVVGDDRGSGVSAMGSGGGRALPLKRKREGEEGTAPGPHGADEEGARGLAGEKAEQGAEGANGA